jgi:hypothetical protein
MKLDHCLSTCKTMDSKWIKDLNERSETLKLLEETKGKTLEDIGNAFLNRPAIAQKIRIRIEKWPGASSSGL